MPQDLASILDHLGVECPAILGVSFGGAIALEYAVEHPQRLRALVLNGVEARFHRTIASTIAQQLSGAIRSQLTALSSTSSSIFFTARSRNLDRSWISWSIGSGKPTKK